MSRAHRFVAILIMWTVAGMFHMLGVMMFAPGAPLYEIAEPAVGVLIKDGWRVDVYLHLVRNIPLLIVGFSLLWGFASEYENQRVTNYR
jgi:ABC-type amino acid transport system permease subunit